MISPQVRSGSSSLTCFKSRMNHARRGGSARAWKTVPERASADHTRTAARTRGREREDDGGGGVIRTREGRFRPLTAFEAVPFVHSGTPPPGV